MPLWTAAEDARLRDCWPEVIKGNFTGPELLAQFPGRTLSALYQRTAKLQLSRKFPRKSDYGDFAERLGWPRDLQPRCVQILELLLAVPALNRRQICERLGLPWKSVKNNGLRGNDHNVGTTYLGILIARGLVVASPRLGGTRRSCRYYCASTVAIEAKSRFVNQDSPLREVDDEQIVSDCTVPSGPATKGPLVSLLDESANDVGRRDVEAVGSDANEGPEPLCSGSGVDRSSSGLTRLQHSHW